MNHAITVGGLLATVAIFAGIVLCAIGALAVFAGGMSDAPSEGDSTSKTGCTLGVVGIVLIVIATLALSACATPAQQIKTVEVKVPVATTPLKPAQVPAVPAPLGPRPQSLSAAADLLLAKHCEFVAYALKADPLLRLSAGMQQQALGRFPECEK